MNIEDIKVGETYNIRVKVTLVNASYIDTVCVDGDGSTERLHVPVNRVSTLTPTTPKYDPCRKFKKGDIVEPVACNGRAPLYLRKYIGTKQVVEYDEDINGIAGIVGDVVAVSAAFLKLITPIEELEPFKVKHDKELSLFEVFQYEQGEDTVEEEGKLHKIVRTTYWYGERQWDRTEAEAKAEAEAERDRLNAKSRKEVEK